MLGLDKDVARLAQQPSAERIRALKRIIPCRTINAILKRSGRTPRVCARVPDWFMVWFVICLGLFCCDCYRQVYRWLQPFRRRGTPGRSTLCEARHRLGVAPFLRLARQVITLLATPQTPESFYRGMRLMAIDGFVVDVPDSPRNALVFGRPGGRTPGAFPQARIVALCEVGTHVIWRWLIKPKRRGEVPMAAYLLRFLMPNMLLLWDRGFVSYANVLQVQQRQANLLARAKSNLILRPLRRLRDRSYLAKLYPSPRHRLQDRDGIVVRVIEYTFRDPGRPGSGERHRLITTLLDWKTDPAKTLILLYHERWEEELAIDEIKTHQRQRPVLRSETPAGVVQEILGLLLGHFVVRKLMFEAATEKGIAPRRLSFTNSLKILRCRLPECPKSPTGIQSWLKNLKEEIGEEILEPRRNRINPRVIKRKISNWRKKRAEHRHQPQPRKKIEQSIVMLC
jgi:Transposase DDE domain/Insertion element 4 transposase N-terminal